MAVEVGGIIVPIGANIRNLLSNTKKVSDAVRQMSTKAGITLNRMEKRFDKAKRSVLSLRNAGTLLAGTFVFKEVIQAGLQMEKMNAKIKAATGTVEASAVEMQFLNREVDRLGLSLETAGDDFGTLSASANGTTLAGQGVRDIFTSVAEASSVLKLSADQTSGAVLAISQIMSKGTVQAEELRGQLGERLPGAFQIAARAMGKTTAELGKMLEMGEVTAEDFLPKFAAAMRKTYAKQVPDAVNSAQASINRFQNTMFRMKADIAKGGILDGFTSALKFLSNTIIPNVQAGLTVLTGNILTVFETVRKEARKAEAFMRQTTAGTLAKDAVVQGTMVGSLLTFTGVLERSKPIARTYKDELAAINAEYESAIKSIDEITTKGVMDAFGGAEAPIAAPVTPVTTPLASTGLTQKQIDKNIKDAQGIVDVWNNAGEERTAADTRAMQGFLDAQAKRKESAQQVADFEKSLAWSVANNAVAATEAVLGKSRATAIAGIVIQKAMALSANATATASGATLAYASQLVPGDPTSLLRASAAAAKVKLLGAINGGLIAATGLGQIASAATGSGSSSLGGGSLAATNVPPSVTASTDPQQPQGPSQVIFNISGVTDAEQWFETTGAEAIKKLVQSGTDFGLTPEPV